MIKGECCLHSKQKLIFTSECFFKEVAFEVGREWKGHSKNNNYNNNKKATVVRKCTLTNGQFGCARSIGTQRIGSMRQEKWT